MPTNMKPGETFTGVKTMLPKATIVKVHITDHNGVELESFTVKSGNVRLPDPEGIEVEHIAAQLRDHIELRFEVAD
jgi:hypothetical protein